MTRPLELSIDGKPLRVLQLRGRVHVSATFRFHVTAAAESEHFEIADLLGKDCKLTVHSRYADDLIVHGVVMSVESIFVDGSTGYELELTPKAELLALGQDSHVYQDMSVIDVIKAVLSAGAIDDVTWKTSGTHAKRAYVVQYRESDLAFIERLCADEGIYYYFELGDETTTLVFADDSTSADELPKGAAIRFRDDNGLLSDTDWVSHVHASSTLVSDAVRMRDYNPRKPAIKLDANAKDGGGALELYDYPGHFATPSDGAARCKLVLEAARARRHLVTGRSDSARLRPGLTFEIEHHDVNAINQRCFCIAASYEARDPWIDEQGKQGDAKTRGASEDLMTVTWEAIPASTPFRPPRRDLMRQSGAQTGIVCGASGSEVHTDDNGQIRVQFYWDRVGVKDDKASTPMRVGQPALVGSMILPRVGWDQIAFHHEGDVDAPMIVGHLYEGRNKVPYPLPANKTRSAWQTATTPGDGSSNEVRFEDKAGSEEMFLNASKDMTVTVGDNSQHEVGANHTHKIGANHDITVGSECSLGVKSNQDVSIGASETRTVSGNYSMSVNGAETTSIGGSRSLTAIMGDKVDADGGRTLTVGGSMMAIGAMGVSRSSIGSMDITVAGSWIAAAATGLANTTVGAGSETVGGAKLQAGAAGVTLKCKGALAETVGGAYISTTGGKCGESSDAALAITAGGAFVGTAPSIEIEAETELKIICGGSSITITSGSIEIKSPAMASPGASVGTDGGTIDHNP